MSSFFQPATTAKPVDIIHATNQIACNYHDNDQNSSLFQCNDDRAMTTKSQTVIPGKHAWAFRLAPPLANRQDGGRWRIR